MRRLLELLAIFGAIAGGLLLSQVTVGVGVIAGAILLAIFARLAQAEVHQKELLSRIDAISRRDQDAQGH